MVTILHLPAEMQAIIATNLSNSSLRAYRQCNSEPENSSHDEFTKRFFTLRRHLFTVHSLGRLREISCSTVAQHVRALEFVPCPVVDVEEHEGNSTQSEFQNVTKNLRNLQAPNSKVLTEIFTNFNNVNAAQCSLRLFAGPWSDHGWGPYFAGEVGEDGAPTPPTTGIFGVATLIRFLEGFFHVDNLSPGSLNTVFRRVTRALLKSHHNISNLDFGGGSFRRLNSHRSFSLISPQDFGAICQDTKDLVLGFHDEPPEVLDWKKIAMCSNLKSLTIDGGDLEFLGLPLAAQSLIPTSVEFLHLSGMRTTELGLIEYFLEVLPERVRNIWLSLMTLIEGSWSEVCRALLQRRLCEIVLTGIKTDGEAECFSAPSLDEFHVVKGGKEVQDFLQGLIDRGCTQ